LAAAARHNTLHKTTQLYSQYVIALYHDNLHRLHQKPKNGAKSGNFALVPLKEPGQISMFAPVTFMQLEQCNFVKFSLKYCKLPSALFPKKQ